MGVGITMNRLILAVSWASLGLVLTAQPAWAYLDPGTGSLILQGLTAGVAGVLVVGKLYFAKLKSFLPGGGRRESARSLDDMSADRPGDPGPSA
jgi:hypothetical protein